jgi:ADP-ribose pyrophosphatase YjhB (NUDIX family)
MDREKKLAGPIVKAIPEGDTIPRLVCNDCGFIRYENPKIIVGAICEWENKILLCKRAIEPRLGYWTPPGGFMELDETTAQGAAREVWEEACTRVEISEMIGLYEVPHISQVHIFYRARLLTPEFAAGYESLEVGLFSKDEIPWDELAFSSSTWAMKRYFDGEAGVGYKLGEHKPAF